MTLANLCSNPSFESDTTGWIAAPGGLGPGTFVRTTLDAEVGTACVAFGNVSAGANYAGQQIPIPVAINIGDVVRASVYVRGLAGREGLWAILGNPVPYTGDTNGGWASQIGAISTSWQQFAVAAWTSAGSYAAGATYLTFAYNASPIAAPAQTVHIDAIRITVNDATVATYFDGNSPGCAWTGTPNDSTSVVATAPIAVTNAATSIDAYDAILNATVNPEGFDTNVQFQYGTTTGYGTTTTTQDAGSGSANVAITQTLGGLQPSTTYHYRIVATNTGGTTNGADQTFTTPAAPVYAIFTPATKAQWELLLCDANGNPLAELATASGKTIAYKRNSYAEVNFTISHQDDAAALLLTALATTGIPKLKAYRRGPNDSPDTPAALRFRGPLAALSEQSDEDSLLTATFRSPFCVLAGDGDKAGRFLTSQFPTVYAVTDAGLIAKGLIDTANADSNTGLATSTLLVAATTTRNATYPTGQAIGSAITDLAALLDGFDFYETFVDGAGSTDANFNVVASQGIINPTARFEYGPQTLSNVASVSRTTTPPMNTIFMTGGNGLTSTYSDSTSVAEYGKWWGHYDDADTIDQATLDAKARALCRPNPVKTVTIVPELGLKACPKPFDDWNLGDTVPFYANRSALIENTQMRINGFTIPIDENGYESATVDDPTSPEDDAVAMAQLDAEIDVTS